MSSARKSDRNGTATATRKATPSTAEGHFRPPTGRRSGARTRRQDGTLITDLPHTTEHEGHRRSGGRERRLLGVAQLRGNWGSTIGHPICILVRVHGLWHTAGDRCQTAISSERLGGHAGHIVVIIPIHSMNLVL
mmetsp:Transcript_27461/g.69515  ORF Transcript_27461/g.69515 Transcript_27461/m.69515 type:complete len:135 (-) Transcript_27461:82-486(-)